MLRKIAVCQNTVCQNKGSKMVLNRFQSLLKERYADKYPNLHIVAWDCMGDCEMGPVVKVNDSTLLRLVDQDTVDKLMADPETVIGQVMHVLEQDRETFERIVSGDLY
ncbi:MAG: (2Fe-2S) ferredoxin domain-containing protein [Candidatus Kerfeldbacteria bacterium]|nr:(2Fe-2S) ferredoxin domain-containing protein [Candidatus Kerfeldbacteria bacterium]